MKHLLTVSEAADKLRMTTARVVRLANRGVIPTVMLPDVELRFDDADLDEWILQFKRPAQGADPSTEESP